MTAFPGRATPQARPRTGGSTPRCPDPEVRVGVIGTGMIGQDHIRRITQVLTGGSVTAVNDVDAARAGQVAAGLPGVGQPGVGQPGVGQPGVGQHRAHIHDTRPAWSRGR